MGTNNIEFLEWDTRFFGRRIARVQAARLSPDGLQRILTDARARSIECIYFLAGMDDVLSLCTAESARFSMMDLRITLERRVIPSGTLDRVRRAGPKDKESLQQICHGAFKDTRFSRDPHFAAHADRLYETWIARAIDGRADAVLVIENGEGEPLGFACCHRREEKQGELGLTAVRSDQRGSGIGTLLVSAALAWFDEEELTTAFVVTNGCNVPAQRLYQRTGFLTREMQVWYHGWLSTT